MPIQINESLQNFSPKPLDRRYCKFSGGKATPYNEVAEALAAVNIAYRYQGLTLLISVAGAVKEYWFYGGTADSNLVLRDIPLALVATTGSYTDLLNLPGLPPGQVNSDWAAADGLSAILNKPTAVSAFANDAGYLSAIAAINGLSTVNNTVVFGQDVGQPGNPAELQSSREIPLGFWSFQFTDDTSTIVFSSGDFNMTSNIDDSFYFIDITTNGFTAMNLVDTASGTPSIFLSGGGNSIIRNGGLNDRLEVTANQINEITITSGLYLYPGIDLDSVTPRAYISSDIDPATVLPGGSLIKDVYQQALVVLNTNEDDAGVGDPVQGTFAAVSKTWNTLTSPTLILGKVDSNIKSGGNSKLIDLQLGGFSRFKVYANSGNTIVGNTDNGNFFQVQQPPVSGSTSPSAIHITTAWNTTAAPSLVKANIADTASSDASRLIDLEVNNVPVFTVTKKGEVTTGDPGSGTGKWKLGKQQNASVDLDTTMYLEVNVDGIAYKLALVAIDTTPPS
ncbi:MAG TPA: hypothetical protein VGM30_10570 [Puia sp.]|jgi:hypothetical protein